MVWTLGVLGQAVYEVEVAANCSCHASMLASLDLSDRFLRDSNVRIGHVHSVSRYVVETFVCIDAGRALVLAKFDGLESNPRRVLLRQVLTRRLCGEGKYAAGASEDV
jgi:hypothetical protein